MSAIGLGDGLGHKRFLEQLTRDTRLRAPLLERIRRSFYSQEWIDPGLIGRLYEQELAEKKVQQKASGSFYTPAYLVDFVVHHTLGPLLRSLALEKVFQLRILDPSWSSISRLRRQLPGAGSGRECSIEVPMEPLSSSVLRSLLWSPPSLLHLGVLSTLTIRFPRFSSTGPPTQCS